MGLTTLVIAFLISATPFASVFYFMKLSFVRETVGRSIFTLIILTALSFSASAVAIKTYDIGAPKPDNGCDMTPLLFIFLGFIFTVLTLIFGILYTYINYKTRNTLK